MAKDDYFVIVYQILTYLYACLKQGKPVNVDYIKVGSPLFKANITEDYWRYIIEHMYKQGFVEGVVVDDTIDNAPVFIWKLEQTRITPDGIEYLNENSMMAKVRKYLKEAKDIIPGV